MAGALAQHAEADRRHRAGAPGRGARGLRNLVTAQGTRQVADRDELLSAFARREDAEEVVRVLVGAHC
ncbi:MAG: hypothetical protein U0599_24775 [Vicinamibacteria bacterium]